MAQSMLHLSDAHIIIIKYFLLPPYPSLERSAVLLSQTLLLYSHLRKSVHSIDLSVTKVKFVCIILLIISCRCFVVNAVAQPEGGGLWSPQKKKRKKIENMRKRNKKKKNTKEINYIHATDAI